MFEGLFARFGYTPMGQKTAKRNYSGANVGRLFSSWQAFSQPADAEIRASIATLRARARELARNNDYVKKYIEMVHKNVVGANGITLQVRSKDPKGTLDTRANTQIEDNFAKWGKKGNCDVTGRFSWRDVQNVVIMSVAQDGEVLVRLIFDKKKGLQLQIIEADMLDETYNNLSANISMGIEYDNYGRPQFYHVFKYHPASLTATTLGNKRERIPADEIIHLYRSDRASQGRGVTWLRTAMTRLKMLEGYEEAELTAARVGAAKMGFYTSPVGEDYVGDGEENGSPIMDAEPGVFEVLPEGWDFKPFDPQHPTSAFSDFIKSTLRGIASGLGVSYNYLSGDLEGVSYSSIRAGVLDERDSWRDIQAWMIETLCDKIYERWLEYALLTKNLPLPIEKYDKFNAATWQARGWAWVDPLKDMQASILAINAGLKTAASVAAEQGGDIEDIYLQLSQEAAMREKLGIKTDFNLKQEAIDAQNQNNNATD
ncbi:MAG: phage portal protein [Sulfuricurvum sp.]|nr:phage portal protein [Sulfuricurvum sp.]